MLNNYFSRESLKPKFERIGNSMEYLSQNQNNPNKRRLVEKPVKPERRNDLDSAVIDSFLDAQPKSIDFESLIKKNQTSLGDIEKRISENTKSNMSESIKRTVRLSQKKYFGEEKAEDEKEEQENNFKPSKYLGKFDNITKKKKP